MLNSADSLMKYMLSGGFHCYKKDDATLLFTLALDPGRTFLTVYHAVHPSVGILSVNLNPIVEFDEWETRCPPTLGSVRVYNGVPWWTLPIVHGRDNPTDDIWASALSLMWDEVTSLWALIRQNGENE